MGYSGGEFEGDVTSGLKNGSTEARVGRTEVLIACVAGTILGHNDQVELDYTAAGNLDSHVNSNLDSACTIAG